MRPIFKRIAAAFTAAALTICLMPEISKPTAAAAEEKHTHKVCGGLTHDGCTHEDIEFEPFAFTFDENTPQCIIRGKSVYLTGDIELNDNNRIFVEKGVTNLCLNGHSIKKGGSFGDCIIDINTIDGVPAELNICDCKGGGSIINTSTAEREEYYGLISVLDDSVLNLYGGTIDAGLYCTAVTVNDTGSPLKSGPVNIYGGKIKAGDGHGLCLYEDANAALFVYGGEITSDGGFSIISNAGNTAAIYGGNISATVKNRRGSTLTIDDGTVSSGTSYAIDNYGSLYISGGSISSKADTTIENVGTTEITGGTISGESAYVITNYKNADLKISGGTFNAATYLLYNRASASADIKGGRLVGGTEYCFWNNGTLNISYGEIISAGYPIKNNALLNISGGSFKHKNSSDSKNYIVNDGELNLSGSPMFENTAIWLESSDNIGITEELAYNNPCLIYMNSAAPRIFTSGWSTYMDMKKASDYFKSPYSLCTVAESEGEAVLRLIKIIFNANGGECETTDISVNDNGQAAPLPEPTRQGYTFDGWFTEKEGGKKITEDTVFGGDTELYAHWSECEHNNTYKNDDAQHWTVCEKCGMKGEKTNHQWDSGETVKAPTETEPDAVIYTCTVCGATKTEYLNHTHTYSDDWSSDENNHWHAATCGHNVRGEEAEHNFGLPQTTPSTCTNQGSEVYICQTCGYKKTVSLPLAEHSFGDVWHTDTDNHWKECEICGTAKGATAAHTWNNGEVTKQPTETEAGVKTYTCTVCEKTKEETIAPLNHSHDWSAEWSKDDTYHWHDCLKNCGEKSGEAAHIWDGGSVTKEPTESAEGEKTFECTFCGKTKTEPITAAGGTDQPENPENPDNPDIPEDPEEPSDTDGSISTEVQPGENAPETSLKTPLQELAEAVLTQEEKESVTDGVSIKIILTVNDATDTVPEEDKAKVEAAVNGLAGYRLGQYLDVNLLKIIGDMQTKITETNTPITVMFELPEALRGYGRNYSVIRVHSGEAAVLPDSDNDINTITIETDRFSTYALVYSEKANIVLPDSENRFYSNDTAPKESEINPAEISGTSEAYEITPSTDNESSSANESIAASNESTPQTSDSPNAPSGSIPTRDNDNPSTGIAISLIPLTAAIAVLTFTAKRKKK